MSAPHFACSDARNAEYSSGVEGAAVPLTFANCSSTALAVAALLIGAPSVMAQDALPTPKVKTTKSKAAAKPKEAAAGDDEQKTAEPKSAVKRDPAQAQRTVSRRLRPSAMLPGDAPLGR